jgi:hypothetical protein
MIKRYTTILAFVALVLGIVSCGEQKETPIPDVHGQMISKEAAAKLAYDFITIKLHGNIIESEKQIDVETTLPQIHKWFTVGWGLIPHQFTNGKKLYKVRPIPQYVLDDLDQVLVPNYTPFLPLILTSAFWHDMKKLTENPIRPVVLAFQTHSMDAGVATSEAKITFFYFSLISGTGTFVHEGTHLRQFFLEKQPASPDLIASSGLTKECYSSLTIQLREIDAYYRASFETRRIPDAISYWYQSWSDEELKTFLKANFRIEKTGDYVASFDWVTSLDIPAIPDIIYPLHKSCPQILQDQLLEISRRYYAQEINLSLRVPNINKHAGTIYQSIDDDLATAQTGGKSCLSDVRDLDTTIDPQTFFKIPTCKQKFGYLPTLAEESPQMLDQQVYRPFFKEYLEALKAYSTLLSQTSSAYRRLSGTEDRQSANQILNYLPKEFFNENN